MLLTLAELPMWAISILVVFYVLVSVVMILAVLIQRPQGGGLSTAFGAGAGSGQTAFGTKIGDALTIFTIVVFLLFLGTSIGLVYLLRPTAPAAQTPAITAPGPDQRGTAPQPAQEPPAPSTPPATVPSGAEPEPGLPGAEPGEAPGGDPGEVPPSPGS